MVLQCATVDPDGRKRALIIGGGIANFTDVAATFNGIIRALKEKVCSSWIYPKSLSLSFHRLILSLSLSLWQESKLKAARMHIYVRRGGPNYQTGLAKMRTLGEELGVPIEVWNDTVFWKPCVK